MTIRCKDLDQFVEVIAGLVAKGLTFEANADSCVINLLGGF